MSTRSPAQYVYIAGRGHSGSTVLELLLGSHPRFVAMGELEKLSLQFARDESAPYPGRCSCGQRPQACPVWGEVAREVRERFHVDLSTAPFAFRVSDLGLEQDHGIRALPHWLTRLNSRLWRYQRYRGTPVLGQLARLSQQHAEWARRRLFVANVLRARAGAEVVVDSSKDYLGMRDLHQQFSTGVKVLFITRDPRASVWSHVKTGRRTVEQAARAWVNVNRRVRRLLDGIPREDWMHVRYEDLCRDVHGTAERLCDFLGHAYDPRMCQPDQRVHHTIGGNRLRFKPLSSLAEDLTWQRRLQPTQVHSIGAITGPLAAMLGY